MATNLSKKFGIFLFTRGFQLQMLRAVAKNTRSEKTVRSKLKYA